MKRKINSVVIFVFCLFAGLAIAVQIEGVQRFGGSGLILINEVKVYEEKLQTIRADKESAMQKLSENENEIERLEKEKSGKDADLKLIIEEIEKYKMSAGLYDVEGSGIIITIEEPELIGEYNTEKSVIMTNYDLLISLVNNLKRAGAEAISINGQRIIVTTEFNDVGDSLYINTMPTAPPYIIKAIGEPDTIEALLSIRYGIVELMRNQYNLRVNIEQNKRIKIPRYLGDLKFKYAKPLENM